MNMMVDNMQPRLRRSLFAAVGHGSDIRIITMIHVFWTLIVAMAGLVLAWVVDLATVREVVGMITGMGRIAPVSFSGSLYLFKPKNQKKWSCSFSRPFGTTTRLNQRP
jgi:hypothetical protein